MKNLISAAFALLLVFTICGCLAEGDDFMPNSRSIPAELEEIPASYLTPAEQAGQMVRLDYTTWISSFPGRSNDE